MPKLISTHTPLAGRDGWTEVKVTQYQEFLLTRPLRGATFAVEIFVGTADISTHTPLAGRDGIFTFGSLNNINFYSHAPCGARRVGATDSQLDIYFYSHAPCGARRKETLKMDSIEISTHTPLAGRDGFREG